MDTAKAAEIMMHLAMEFSSEYARQPNWKELGRLVDKQLNKCPDATSKEIAEMVADAYRYNR